VTTMADGASFVYNTEPPTRGKVVIVTTCGELDVELWPKETPMACRNFIQLCLEGYYDNNIFHRIVQNFMVQTGDPTGTGEGGESIYGKPFKNEVHSRLRFRHRGIIATANSGKNDNGSQFFITLGECKWLKGQHTIFGKLTGKTIYNLVNIANYETDDNDRPLHPPKILRTDVLLNPFDDIIPRVKEEKKVAPKKKKKRKKKLNLLSFDDQEDGEDVVEFQSKKKEKSAHALLKDDKTLSTTPAVEEDKAQETDINKDGEAASRIREKLKRKNKKKKSEKKADDGGGKKTAVDLEIAKLRADVYGERDEEPEYKPKKESALDAMLMGYKDKKVKKGSKKEREEKTLSRLDSFLADL